MRTTKTILGAVLLACLVVGGVGADEGPQAGGQGALAQSKVEALTRALEVLRVRMEARLETAAMLRQLGRVDEALRVLEDVDAIYERGMARVEKLLGRLEGPRATMKAKIIEDADLPFEEDGISDEPFVGPAAGGTIGIGGGQGGAFQGRRGTGRESDLGAAVTRNAVEDALRWLAAHQSPDGGWEAAGFHRWCDMQPVAEGPDGFGKALYDPGVTGIALLAFLGAGYTNRGDHDFAKTVARGLRYLKNVQDGEGCFGPRTSQHFIYNHAAAALAMVEAYGMTGSPIFRGSAQKALDFCAYARNPYFGWRYGVKPGDNDTSVTGWMLAPLVSARAINADAVAHGRAAPLVIDDQAFDGALAWIEKMTDPDFGRVGYIQRGGQVARPQALIDKFPGDKSEAMTAVGMLIRIWCGEDPGKSEPIRKGAELLRRQPPQWDPNAGTIDMYYWTFGSMAAFQVGGRTWRTWADAIHREIVPNQRKDTDACGYKGSWDPIGPWGADGGRVFSTAMLTLALETAYRYDRVFGDR